MNKFQFIKHLLDTKKFTPAQKERFFKLVSTELSNVEIQDEKILEDIELIKNKIGLKKEKSSGKGILTRLMGEARLKNELGDNEVSGIGSEIRYTTYKNLPSFLRRL